MLVSIEEEIKGAALFSVGVGAMLVTSEVLYHLGLAPAEKTRKLVHLGSGLGVLALPMLVSSHWTVLVLAVLFTGVLAVSKGLGLLQSVHGVTRRSLGAQYYPLSIWLVFFLAEGDLQLLVAPILVLALCDPAAALVGQELGALSYEVERDAYRTLEGSITFAALAYLLLLLVLGLIPGPGTGMMQLLLVPLVIAVMAASVEAVSTGGADNVLVPYTVSVLLSHLRTASPRELGGWVEVMGLMLLLGLATHRRARLSATGLVGLYLVGTMTCMLGGFHWLLPLLLMYGVFISSRSRGRHRERVDTNVMMPLVALGLGALALHVHTGSPLAYPMFLAAVSFESALAWLDHVGRRVDEGDSMLRRDVALAVAAVGGMGVPLLGALAATDPVPVAIAATPPSVGLALALRRSMEARVGWPARYVAGGLAMGLVAAAVEAGGALP